MCVCVCVCVFTSDGDLFGGTAGSSFIRGNHSDCVVALSPVGVCLAGGIFQSFLGNIRAISKVPPVHSVSGQPLEIERY